MSGGSRKRAQEDAILNAFAAQGYERIDPPVLQPADVFLDRLGDAFRSRIYVVAEPDGSELCLRPDFTIPACRLYLARRGGGKGVARLSYAGPIYRRALAGMAEPTEQRQAGVECLGVADRDAADAEVVALGLAALGAAAARPTHIRIGDLSLFHALVAAVDLPSQWRDRLLRHFARPAHFARLLSRLSGNGAPQKERALLSTLAGLRESEARAVIADILALANISPVGGRSIEDITERLLEQAADASALSQGREAVALIERFLEIEGPPERALADVEALARNAGLDLSAALGRVRHRLALLADLAGTLPPLSFATSFGRGLDYYTGFVFEILGAKGAVLAAGGRYDRLLADLGAAKETPAVGVALFCDRIALPGAAS